MRAAVQVAPQGACRSLPACRRASGPPTACAPGGAAGIGYACAQALGRAGAMVLVADIDGAAAGEAEAQLRAEGIEAASTACDVGNKQEVGAGPGQRCCCSCATHGSRRLNRPAGMLLAAQLHACQSCCSRTLL